MSVETAFAQLPTLRTDRFVLRALRPSDAEAILDLFSNEEVMIYNSEYPYTSLDNAFAFLQRVQTRFEERSVLRWGVTRPDDDIVIGTCGLHRFRSEYRCAETGYNLNRAAWGQGVMSECIAAVLAFGFQDLGLERIEAVIDDTNTASKKLLLKLGFTYEARLRKRYLMKDRMLDEDYYGLLKSEWLQRLP